jgi:hypothetical protein
MATNMSNVTMMIGNGQKDQLSDAVRGDGYYGYRDGVHTMAIQFNQFLGKIQIEATLELDPGPADWFPIWLTPSHAYREFNAPKTGTEAFTFQGNFVLVRFRKEREYLNTTSPVGDITKVMFSI